MTDSAAAPRQRRSLLSTVKNGKSRKQPTSFRRSLTHSLTHSLCQRTDSISGDKGRHTACPSRRLQSRAKITARSFKNDVYGRGRGGPFAVVSSEQRISNLEWHYFFASLYTEEGRKAVGGEEWGCVGAGNFVCSC